MWPRLRSLALALTVAVLVLSWLGAPGTSTVRSWGGAVLGPLERWLAPARDGRATAVALDRADLIEQLRAARAAASDDATLASLLAAPTTQGAVLVPAHVVGVARAGAAAPERLTLDVGSRDGVSVDQCVVAPGGLVGRVVSTSPWTSDVALIGSADVVVGARVGTAGTLGTVGPATPGARGPRSAGQLDLELLGLGPVAVGDRVTTLGSVDGRPYPAGVLIGTVARVDDPAGRLTPSGALTPAVDVARLDVVAVLRTAPRVAPRPAVTGGVP